MMRELQCYLFEESRLVNLLGIDTSTRSTVLGLQLGSEVVDRTSRRRRYTQPGNSSINRVFG